MWLAGLRHWRETWSTPDNLTLQNASIDDDRRCEKCGNRHTRIIGQSVSPPVFYFTCQDCGYSTAVASSPKAAPPSGSLRTEQVERIVRTVVTEFDLPADLVSVADAGEGWQVVLRTRSNRIVRLHALVPEPGPIRAAITRALASA